MAKSVHSWQSTASSRFKYEPLNISSPKPSFRLAILHPGTRESTVRVTLAPTTFADRPRYEALSYTWGSPEFVKGIEMNGIRVDVRENLWFALVHLRNATQERGLWVDAICINQADIDERNHQVKLMAHIYERAQTVLVWLGVDNRGVRWSGSSPPKLGTKIRMLADSATESTLGKLVDSMKVRAANLTRADAFTLCDQPYWKRVWIVQEIGSATDLIVHWGGITLTWDDFSKAIKTLSPDNIDLAWKLIQQREDRHGDGFLLANLIEVCQDSLCEEPRDKIYGFVGIAHDCEDGSLEMDYSKSLFEVYEDVINFENSLARVTSTFINKEDEPTVITAFGKAQHKRKASLHFSQLVQKALGGRQKMLEDYAKHHPDRKSAFYPPTETLEIFRPFRVIGVHSGTISIIGPTFNEIIGIPDSSRKWKAELSKTHIDIEKLRRKNEGFMRVLFNLNRLDLGKVLSIDPHFSSRKTGPTPQSPHSNQSERDGEPKFLFGSAQISDTEDGNASENTGARLFLTNTGLLGLIPPSVKQWDMVYQFWHSDSVAIIRKEGDYLRLVGRGVVANDHFMENLKFQEPDNEVNGYNFDKDGEELFMDMRTLQLMTQ